VEADVDEVCGQLMSNREPAPSIRDYERYAVASEELVTVLREVGGVAGFERMAITHPVGRADRRVGEDAWIMLGGQPSRGSGVVGKETEKSIHPIPIKGIGGGKLPEEGAGFASQLQDAAGEEVGESIVNQGELLIVSDESASLDRKDKFIGGVLGPPAEYLGGFEAVKGPVQLDRVEMVAGMSQPGALGQTGWVEITTPPRVNVAAGSNEGAGD
jgi:hypothetical protein